MCAAAMAQTGPEHEWTVQSPNGGVAVHVALQGQLTYSISFHGRPVIVESPLGLEFREGLALTGPNLRFVNLARSSVDTSWTNLLGKSNPVRDQYNQEVVSFGASASATMKLLVRAFDDGAAFRYEAISTGSQEAVIQSEKTEFRFPNDPTVWAATYDGFSHPYEHEYAKAKLSSIYPSSLIGLPLLVETDPQTFVGITEADLTDWAGMYLKTTARNAPPIVKAALSPRLDGDGLVKVKLPHSSPWRVVMIGSKPGDLIESNLIVNLSPPSAIANTSWIQPGKMAWDHWWSGDVKMDNETEKRFIKFAGEMGFPYQLVDWQWYGTFNKPGADITKPAPQLNMPELLRYAKEQKVRLWLWLHSGDVNRALKAGTLDEAFTVYQRWGIAGVKIDFMERDDQEMVNWYSTVVELAAKHRLMMDYHGAFKPTGLRRTWPNLLTREGVLGNEYNKVSGRVTPEHKLTLPFTRMLAGPMDYTPGGFLNRSPAEWKETTPTEVMGSRPQELALFVVYESPLMCVADDPDHYRGQPGLDFLKVVPTVWDETRVLEGTVGKHILLARRKGNDWYVGGMTGDDEFQAKLPLSFLGNNRYLATIFADPNDPNASYEQVNQTEQRVTAKDVIDVRMRPAGGVAIYFRAE